MNGEDKDIDDRNNVIVANDSRHHHRTEGMVNAGEIYNQNCADNDHDRDRGDKICGNGNCRGGQSSQRKESDTLSFSHRQIDGVKDVGRKISGKENH